MHCLCCSGKLLRHIGQDGLYWYCTTCRQAMPVASKDSSLITSCHPKQAHQRDRTSKYKQYWLYILLKPESKTA